MKKNYYLQMKCILAAAILFSAIWLRFTIGRCINIAELTQATAVKDSSLAAIHTAFIVTAGITSVILVIIQLLFLGKQLSSLKNGTLFARGLHKYIIAWGIVWIIYSISYETNADGVLKEMVIHGDTFGVPVVMLTFAILYKIAAEVSEENNLTI